MYREAIQVQQTKQRYDIILFKDSVQFSQYSNSLVMVLNSGPKRISEEGWHIPLSNALGRL
jgi:hypothetical protein